MRSKRRSADGDFELSVELPELLAPEVVEKGSIAIDGVSLTVVRVTESSSFFQPAVPAAAFPAKGTSQQ